MLLVQQRQQLPPRPSTRGSRAAPLFLLRLRLLLRLALVRGPPGLRVPLLLRRCARPHQRLPRLHPPAPAGAPPRRRRLRPRPLPPPLRLRLQWTRGRGGRWPRGRSR